MLKQWLPILQKPQNPYPTSVAFLSVKYTLIPIESRDSFCLWTSGMGKRGSGEMKKVVEQGQGRRNQNSQDQTPHPYAFHVSGPRKLPSLNWRDLITSTWSVPPSSLHHLSLSLCMFVRVFMIKTGFVIFPASVLFTCSMAALINRK